MDIYRWNHTNQEWVPYICNDHKIMLEFVMLDPYFRVPLEKKIGSPTYQASFKVIINNLENIIIIVVFI